MGKIRFDIGFIKTGIVIGHVRGHGDRVGVFDEIIGMTQRIVDDQDIFDRGSPQHIHVQETVDNRGQGDRSWLSGSRKCTIVRSIEEVPNAKWTAVNSTLNSSP